jgi:hypothetical protein
MLFLLFAVVVGRVKLMHITSYLNILFHTIKTSAKILYINVIVSSIIAHYLCISDFERGLFKEEKGRDWTQNGLIAIVF